MPSTESYSFVWSPIVRNCTVRWTVTTNKRGPNEAKCQVSSDNTGKGADTFKGNLQSVIGIGTVTRNNMFGPTPCKVMACILI